MNRRVIASLALFSLAAFFFVPGIPRANAIGLLDPFGAKVIIAPVPGITCPGGQAFYLEGKSGLYATTAATKVYLFNELLPTDWALGLAGPVPLPVCATNTTPPVPVIATPVIMIGTSLPSL